MLVPSIVFGSLGESNDVVSLKARVDGIGWAQGKILTELETLKMQTASEETGTEEVGTGVIIEGEARRNESTNAALAEKIEEVEKKSSALIEMVKLE